MRSVFVVFQLIWTFQSCVRGEVSLTTATPRSNHDGVIPTTTVSYGRVPVDKYAAEESKVAPDFFDKLKNMDRRRKINEEIWNWDYWCQLQAQKGNCTKNLRRHYYNSLLDRCDEFTYSGCLGNKNNFKTSVDCERHCKGAAFMRTKFHDRSISCSLQPNTGLCVALFRKYYYDVNSKTCEEFQYSGCGGNPNRFSTQHHCYLKCGNKEVVDF